MNTRDCVASCNQADQGYTTESLAALVWCCSLRLQVTWPFEYMDSWVIEWKQQGETTKKSPGKQQRETLQWGPPATPPPLVIQLCPKKCLPYPPSHPPPDQLNQNWRPNHNHSGTRGSDCTSCQPLVKHHNFCPGG